MKDVREHAKAAFKERFKAERTKRGMNQADFAAFIGLSRATVGFYENGDHIAEAATLAVIAARCEVSSDYLIGLTDNSSREASGMDKQIGLSEKAVATLRENKICRIAINRILESSDGEPFLKSAARYHMLECTREEYQTLENTADFYLRMQTLLEAEKTTLNEIAKMIMQIFTPATGEESFYGEPFDGNNELIALYQTMYNAILRNPNLSEAELKETHNIFLKLGIKGGVENGEESKR